MKNYDEEYIQKSFRASNSDKDFLFLINFVKNLIYPNEVLNFTYSELLKFAETTSNNSNYYTFFVQKKNGRKRFIHAPYQRLKHLQKCINTILSINLEPSEFAHGYVNKKDIKTNARYHIGQQYVFNADLKDFFPSITKNSLKESFVSIIKEDLILSDKKSIFSLITDICFVKDKNKFILPHGSPTSPILSNIVCKILDFELSNLASTYSLNYTRYADDITFSGQNDVFQPQNEFYLKFLEIINKNNFSINLSKKRIQKFTNRQIVTGLIVNQKINVPKRYIKDLRKWIHFLEIYGIEKTQNIYLKQFNKNKCKSILLILNGKLNYLKNIKGLESNNYIKLKQRFDYILKNHQIDLKILYYTKTVFSVDSVIFTNYFFDGEEFISHVEKYVSEEKKAVYFEIKEAVKQFKLSFTKNPKQALSDITWSKSSPKVLPDATLRSDVLLNRKHQEIIIGTYNDKPIITLQDNKNLYVVIPKNDATGKDKDLLEKSIINNEYLVDLVKSKRFTPELYDVLKKIKGIVELKDGTEHTSYLLKTKDTYEEFRQKVITQYESFQKISPDLTNISEVFSVFPVSYGLSLPEQGTISQKPLTDIESEITFSYDGEIHTGVTFTYRNDGEGNKYATFRAENSNLKKKLQESFAQLTDDAKKNLISHYGVVTAALNPSGEQVFNFKPTRINVEVLDILKKLRDEGVYEDRENFYNDYDIITYIVKDGEYIEAKINLSTRMFNGRKKIIAALFETEKTSRMWEIKKGTKAVGEVEIEIEKIKDNTTLEFHPITRDEEGKKVVDRKSTIETTFIQPIKNQLLLNPYKFNPSEVSVFKLNKHGDVYDVHYVTNRPNVEYKPKPVKKQKESMFSEEEMKQMQAEVGEVFNEASVPETPLPEDKEVMKDTPVQENFFEANFPKTVRGKKINRKVSLDLFYQVAFKSGEDEKLLGIVNDSTIDSDEKYKQLKKILQEKVDDILVEFKPETPNFRV